MTKCLLITALLISSLSGICQEKKLIQNYTFRIDRFKSFDFSVAANGNKTDVYDFGSYAQSAASGNFNGNFFTIKSKDNLLQTISTGLAVSGAASKNSNPSGVNKVQSSIILPSFYMNNKWYFKKNFVEVGTNISDAFAASRSNEYRGITQEQVNTSNFINAGITLGAGKGRLENITDMQNAIWVQIMLKEGNLKRRFSEEEIIGLAKTITASNNRRVLDGRKRIQFILKNVDGYLQQKELISKTDINYFSNLNDVLFFANNVSRQAGTEKYIRFIPAIVSYNSTREYRNVPITKSTQNDDGVEMVLKIGLQKFKPLNLSHQIDYGAALRLSYGNAKSKYFNYNNSNIDYSIKNSNEWNKAGLDYFLGYSIIPNTRTSVAFKLQAQNGYQALNGVKELYHSFMLETNASYFISYNTRLNFNVGARYNKNNFDIRSVNFYNNSYLYGHNLDLFCNGSLAIAL